MLGASPGTTKGYILATAAGTLGGAVAGGVGVALATKAIPKIMDVMAEH